MVNVEPVCRCGTERIVSGKGVICPHCDRACVTASSVCQSCRTLRLTCTDCRTLHPTEKARSTCEMQHR